MSIETGVLVSITGEPIYWHLPPGRNSAYLPDSRNLWEVIWENRDNVLGFAHSHPGSGIPGPSWEDLTTFAAVEAALGKRLCWWITSEDGVILLTWQGDSRYNYGVSEMMGPLNWLEELRDLSYKKEI